MNLKDIDTSKDTDLCEIFFKNRADKCKKIFHTYSNYYHEILNDRREKVRSVLEIGVGNPGMIGISGEDYKPGASLRSWREYFPNAQIFGLDIARSVLFEEERIACFFADQNSESSLLEAVQEIKSKMNDQNHLFDLIIDDGNHSRASQIISLLTLENFLAPDGLYIIEDIKASNVDHVTKIRSKSLKLQFTHRGSAGFFDNFTLFEKA